MSQVTVQALVQGPSLSVVHAHSLNLHQCAQHEKQMKDLVALANKVAAAREPALWMRVSEEEGTDQKEEDLIKMESYSWVGATLLWTVACVNAMHHWADI